MLSLIMLDGTESYNQILIVAPANFVESVSIITSLIIPPPPLLILAPESIIAVLLPLVVVLIASFIAMTWLAAKIYRTGILLYGKKVNYKELFKWIRYRNY